MTMRIKFLGIFTALLVNSANAQAESRDWINIGPIVSNDVRAFVDYQIESSVPEGDIWRGQTPMGPSSFRQATHPLWINVLRSNLNETDHVFVQLISYERSCYRGECIDTQRIVEASLGFAESGRFSGELSSIILDYQLNDGYALTSRKATRQELVIWINGVLVKDPRTGQNLSFTMPLRR